MQKPFKYKDTLQFVLDNGITREDRTGVGRHSVFSPPDEIYDLSEGLPLSGLRAIKTRATINELIWFISGSTWLQDLRSKFFWERWTVTREDLIAYCEKHGIEPLDGRYPAYLEDRVGTIGNLYGVSWRNAPGPKGEFLPVRQMKDLPKSLLEKFINIDPDDGVPRATVQELINYIDGPSEDDDVATSEIKAEIRGAILKEYWRNFDQLNELIYKIKKTPYSSRLRVSAYLTDYMAFEEFSPQENTLDGRACLTPCHTFFQCYVSEGKLDLKLTLTSSDVPVGRVYNIVQYAMLCEMIAQVCGLKAGRLIVSTGDAHIYTNQFEAVKEILKRDEPQLPRLVLNKEITSIFDFTPEDIQIVDYNPHPAVEVPVSV